MALNDYLNDDQLAHMKSLAKIPADQKCYCGWNRLGECSACKARHPGKTAADKLREMPPPKEK